MIKLILFFLLLYQNAWYSNKKAYRFYVLNTTDYGIWWRIQRSIDMNVSIVISIVILKRKIKLCIHLQELQLCLFMKYLLYRFCWLLVWYLSSIPANTCSISFSFWVSLPSLFSLSLFAFFFFGLLLTWPSCWDWEILLKWVC